MRTAVAHGFDVGIEDVVQGYVAPGFEAVREAFISNFAGRGEEGAAVCVYRDGRPVVDLWGGWQDRRAGQPWQEDTVGLIFSATKGLTAIAALHLVERGLLDLEAPVAQYWPEFAANGKGQLPVRQLLTHEAGLPGFSRLMNVRDLHDWDGLAADLAGQAPAWEPGTGHGYHAFTFGWLVGEVVRRITGLTPGAYLREQLCDPLGLDIWFGLPEAQRHRYARITQSFDRQPDAAEKYQPLMRDLAKFAAPGATTNRGMRMSMAMLRSPMRPVIERQTDFLLRHRRLTDAQRAFNTMLVTVDDLASDRTLDVEFPAANGICTARSLARLYAALIGPVGAAGSALSSPAVLSPELMAAASQRLVHGEDRVLQAMTAFGFGFMVKGTMQFDDSWGDGAFGHPGNGGAIGLADPDRGIAVGYVRKRITQLVRNDTTNALLAALNRCL